MRNNRYILRPDYMKKFSCIGSKCEDTCCAGWDIHIDEESYKKYNRIKQYPIKKKIEKYIARNRSNPTRYHFAHMKKNGEQCTFLTEEGWCEIHRDLGEKYLCITCARYPRIINQVEEVVEESLQLSCPEAARIVLLNKEVMTFDYTEEQGQDQIIFSKVIKPQDELNTDWNHYFGKLRIFIISVLQNREYALDNRLLMLGLFFYDMQELVNQNKARHIPLLIRRYTNNINGEPMNFEEVPKNLEEKLSFYKNLILIAEGRRTTKRYAECFNQVLEGLEFKANLTLEESIQKYQEAYDTYYRPFMEEHSYMLENYLVNYIFRDLVPYQGTNPLDVFIKLILHYSMIKIHLIGISIYNKGLDNNKVVEVVQTVCKKYEHTSGYFEVVLEYMKQRYKFDFALVAMILRD